MNRRYRFVAVLLLVGIAFVLRVAGLDFQSLWRDEVDAVRFAGGSLRDLVSFFTEPGQNGPLFYLLLRPWLALAGRSEYALRFFSAAFGTLTIPLVYRLARRLDPRRPMWAVTAALLAATSPYLVWYSQEGKMYALVVALVLLSMDRYLAALDRGGGWRWLSYVVATTASVYVHLIAALIIPVQAIIPFLLSKETRRRRWRPWLVAMAALTLPYLPLLRWQLPLLFTSGETGYSFVPLHRMLLSLLANYSLGVLPDASFWTAVLFLGLLLLAGFMWVDGGRRRTALAVLACWLLLPLFGFFLLTLLRPMYTARYLVFVLPAFLLLLAAGLTVLGRQSRLLAGLLLAALLALNVWGLVRQAQTPLKADFRAATAHVAARLNPGDLLLFQIPYGHHSFEYYYRPSQHPVGHEETRMPATYRVFLPLMLGAMAEPYRWAEGPYTNAGMTPQALARRMDEITAGADVVWYIASETRLWDQRALTQAWLSEHATLTEEAQFVRVGVYRYLLR